MEQPLKGTSSECSGDMLPQMKKKINHFAILLFFFVLMAVFGVAHLENCGVV